MAYSRFPDWYVFWIASKATEAEDEKLQVYRTVEEETVISYPDTLDIKKLQEKLSNAFPNCPAHELIELFTYIDQWIVEVKYQYKITD